MKIQEVRELIKLIDESSIDEFEYELDGAKIKLKKNSESVTTMVTAPSKEEQAVMTQPAGVTANHEPQAQTESTKQPESSGDSQKEDEHLHKIESPMVGTFYTSPSPDADAYIKVGDKVQEDSVVCIIEAMKLFNEIEADVSGEIVEILVNNGELVEYGQPLFLVKPA
ncbi:MAG TPA: acetyl-CoA carboxylase biotin carboxyl carrier protein [Bacillales bacterium]|nr:acetyl-CoA carboxylase biotin carboxyl carrier protein [Bacillales bacterium]